MAIPSLQKARRFAGAGREVTHAIVVAALVVGGVLALGQEPTVNGVPAVSTALFLLALLPGWKLLRR